MKKSIEDLRRRMSNNCIAEETTQEINAETATNTHKKVRFYTKEGISFPGGLVQLAYIRKKLSDSTNEQPLIPKPRPK